MCLRTCPSVAPSASTSPTLLPIQTTSFFSSTKRPKAAASAGLRCHTTGALGPLSRLLTCRTHAVTGGFWVPVEDDELGVLFFLDDLPLPPFLGLADAVAFLLLLPLLLSLPCCCFGFGSRLRRLLGGYSRRYSLSSLKKAVGLRLRSPRTVVVIVDTGGASAAPVVAIVAIVVIAAIVDAVDAIWFGCN